MKKFRMVDAATLNKLAACFASSEEVYTFIGHMDLVVDELKFNSLLRDRLAGEDGACEVTMRQVCVFALFCREHMELIQDLIRNIDSREMTDDEYKKFKDVL